MSEIKLTKAQERLLRAIMLESVKLMAIHSISETACELTDLGMARWDRDAYLEITDAGRAWLAAHKETDDE